MNILHLLWIVPLAVYFGYGLCAVIVVSKDNKNTKNGKEKYK